MITGFSNSREGVGRWRTVRDSARGRKKNPVEVLGEHLNAQKLVESSVGSPIKLEKRKKKNISDKASFVVFLRWVILT